MIFEYDVYAENEIDVNPPVSNDPPYQALFNKWCDDMKVSDIRKERIESLLANNHC